MEATSSGLVVVERVCMIADERVGRAAPDVSRFFDDLERFIALERDDDEAATGTDSPEEEEEAASRTVFNSAAVSDGMRGNWRGN
jgi:hypothetical protein